MDRSVPARWTLPGHRVWDTYLVTLALLALEGTGDGRSLTELALGCVGVLPAAALAGLWAEGTARARGAGAIGVAAIAMGAAGLLLFGAERQSGAIVVCVGAILGGALAAGMHRWLGTRSPTARLQVGGAIGAACCALGLLVGRSASTPVAAALLVFGAALAVLGVGAWLPAPPSRGAAPAGSVPRRKLAFAAVRGLSALGLFAGAAVIAGRAEGLGGERPEARALLGHAREVIRAIVPAPLVAPPTPTVAAQPPALSLAGWDVLIVTLHALRADHVGGYGYDRATTPALDALAAEGVVFEWAYTPSSRTSNAVASLLTGRFAIEDAPLFEAPTVAAVLAPAGYRSAAWFPPKIEDSEGRELVSLGGAGGFTIERRAQAGCAERVTDALELLRTRPRDERVLFWLHCDEPRFPYDPRGDHAFGQRDVDRYDAEIAETDAAIGALVRGARAARPHTVVVVTSLSGEELGEHGGRRHGSTVYEEQVRVPLIVSAPGPLEPRRVATPVSLVDVLPTLAAATGATLPSGVAGLDLGPAARGQAAPALEARPIFAATPEMALLGRGSRRMVCLRRSEACALYDLDLDPKQRRDAAASTPSALAGLKSELLAVMESIAQARARPSSAEEVLRRADAGDLSVMDAATELLGDRELSTRRAAAKVLFELTGELGVSAATHREIKRGATLESLRTALNSERDPEARAYIALALARLGEGVPLVYELARGGELKWRRLGALVLAEEGNGRGEDDLLVWWLAAFPVDHKPVAPEDRLDTRRARDLMAAFGRLRSKKIVGALIGALDEPELARDAARALALIGEDIARPALADHLAVEAVPSNQVALIEALLALGGGPELRIPLISILGLPELLPNALGYALRADVLEHVGGPARDSELRRMRRFASSGVLVDFLVPELPKRVKPAAGPARARIVCRASAPTGGQIRAGKRGDVPTSSEKKAPIPATRPALNESESVVLDVPLGDGATEVSRDLPATLGVKPGKPLSLVVYATQGVVLEACAIAPLRAPLAP